MDVENGYVLLPVGENVDDACAKVNAQGWEVIQFNRSPSGRVELLMRKVPNVKAPDLDSRPAEE